VPCRAAEATYRSQLRATHRRGLTPLGSRISPKAARKKVTALLVERFTRAEIARRLGIKSAKLRLAPDAITARKAIRIHQLHAAVMAEGPDVPLHDASDSKTTALRHRVPDRPERDASGDPLRL
jgi:hypothetical protein